MARKIRMFKGTTEYYPVSINIELLTENAVDCAEVVIKACDLAVGDEVVFYKEDGTTKIFAGVIVEKREEKLWKLKILGYGWELNNVWITQVYENKSPEWIVENIIENYTNFTYASTSTSGVTLTKYVANDYAYKIIDELARLLDWQFYTDADKNAYFEPKGIINNGRVFEEGVNCKIVSWREDPSKLANKVRLKGGMVNYTTQQSFTGNGSQKEFVLNYKPTSNIRVLVNGVEKSGGVGGKGEYEVDAEQRKIIFATAPASGASIQVTYGYEVPIVVESEAPNSIAKYGVVFKEVEMPSIRTFEDARRFVLQYLDVYSEPAISVDFEIGGIDTTIQQGELITVVDNLRNKNRRVVITKVRYAYPQGITSVEAGSIYYTVYDWQKEVQERIKELEKKVTSETIVMTQRGFKGNLKISLNAVVTKKKRSINDSFILGHENNAKLGTAKLGDRKGAWVEW